METTASLQDILTRFNAEQTEISDAAIHQVGELALQCVEADDADSIADARRNLMFGIMVCYIPELLSDTDVPRLNALYEAHIVQATERYNRIAADHGDGFLAAPHRISENGYIWREIKKNSARLCEGEKPYRPHPDRITAADVLEGLVSKRITIQARS
jgi:hypothetical protein